jgi:hypothetical protein
VDKFTQVPLNKIEFNQNNLYREDSFTDMQVGSIRVLIPVKPDGSEDSSRAALFIGQAQVMSPQGPCLSGPY